MTMETDAPQVVLAQYLKRATADVIATCRFRGARPQLAFRRVYPRVLPLCHREFLLHQLRPPYETFFLAVPAGRMTAADRGNFMRFCHSRGAILSTTSGLYYWPGRLVGRNFRAAGPGDRPGAGRIP